MADKKGWGTTVLGWLVVQDEETGTGSSSDAPPEQSAPPEPSTFFVSPPPASPSGQVAFDQVFEAAGIPAEERDRVTKTRDLLATLPAETDPAVKKQIVEASLKAFGVPIDQIIETGASRDPGPRGLHPRRRVPKPRSCCASRSCASGSSRKRSRRIRSVMDDRVQEQQAVARACNDQKLDVQQVLEFFGQEAVARVVRDSPRLHVPTGGAAGEPD